MVNKILGFIGTGNMGSAIIGGVIGKTDTVNAYDIKKNENLAVNYKEKHCGFGKFERRCCFCALSRICLKRCLQR
ncbi:MAG: hypothetical protein L6V93_01315 [Clostridiales bacterium]|nr:MAG: hypothetical protein L6V93_01315 [Clostridiales bacterium]